MPILPTGPWAENRSTKKNPLDDPLWLMAISWRVRQPSCCKCWYVLMMRMRMMMMMLLEWWWVMMMMLLEWWWVMMNDDEWWWVMMNDDEWWWMMEWWTDRWFAHFLLSRNPLVAHKIEGRFTFPKDDHNLGYHIYNYQYAKYSRRDYVVLGFDLALKNWKHYVCYPHFTIQPACPNTKEKHQFL